MTTACICRLEGKKTLGYQVRVGPVQGYHSKLFSDRKHGGPEPARVAAEEYLEQYLKKHPELAPNGKPYRSAPQYNNRSGVNGVSVTRVHVANQAWPCYGAFFPVHPTLKNAIWQFPESVFGAQARRLAVGCRRAWELACERQELKRFFNLDYPAGYSYPALYFERPDVPERKAHIERDLKGALEDVFWCGRYFESPPWSPMCERPLSDEVCLDCSRFVARYEALVSMLGYYGFSVASSQ